MGKRTRDEVIYSRVDYRVKQEFELQMKESGNKTSADFIDYLLRVNKGRQIDGTTLKQFMEVMNEVCYELKKQGININQLARNTAMPYQEFSICICEMVIIRSTNTLFKSGSWG